LHLRISLGTATLCFSIPATLCKKSAPHLSRRDSTMAAFRNIYTALMLVIAGSAPKQLARQVACLKAENQLPRSRITQRIILTHREKNRVCRFAKYLICGVDVLQ
jgi:hypothetical protein